MFVPPPEGTERWFNTGNNIITQRFTVTHTEIPAGWHSFEYSSQFLSGGDHSSNGQHFYKYHIHVRISELPENMQNLNSNTTEGHNA